MMLLKTLSLSELPINLDFECYLLQLQIDGQFGVGEDSTQSQPVTLDLGALFVGFTVTDVTELTLTANQKLGAHKGYQWKVNGEPEQPPRQYKDTVIRLNASFNVTIAPAEIRTFNVTYSKGPNPKSKVIIY